MMSRMCRPYLLSGIGIACIFSTLILTKMSIETMEESSDSIGNSVLIRRSKGSLQGNRSEWRPWPDNQFCSRFVTRFGKEFPLQYLVSFPRSGNTWLRYLIEGATGVFTGTIYNNIDLFHLGFLGEREPHKSGRTILVKSHAPPLPPKSRIPDRAPVVLLIRNPETSLASFWTFRQENNMFQEDDAESFHSEDFHNHITEHLQRWEKVNEEQLLWRQRLLIVFYENLLKDPLKEVRRVLNFLNYPIDEIRLNCLKKFIMGKAKRKQKKVDDLFNQEEKAMLEKSRSLVVHLASLRGVHDIPEEYKTSVAKE